MWSLNLSSTLLNMYKIKFSVLFGILILFFKPVFSSGNTLKIKFNASDCNSCLFGLNQTNFLKESVLLEIIVTEDSDTLRTKEVVSKIIKRPWKIIVSLEIYKGMTYDRSSFYLFDSFGNELFFGLLDRIDIPRINFISSLTSLSKPEHILNFTSGEKYLKYVNEKYLWLQNIAENSYNIVDVKGYVSKKITADQFAPLIVYKALHKGDTAFFWSKIIRKKSTLEKYGMNELKFESISTRGDSCFVLSTFYEVEKVKNLNGYNNVYSPNLILLEFLKHLKRCD